MSQKAFFVEAVSGKDILGYEPIASQIAEGLHVVSINGFNKDGKSMCAVLLSDEESSGGGGSSSDTLAPPVFSPEDTLHTDQPFSDSIEVTITAEGADVINYNIGDITGHWEEYVEPITLTASTLIYAVAGKGVGTNDYKASPIVAAYYIKS